MATASRTSAGLSRWRQTKHDGGGSEGARRPEALTGGAGTAAAHGARIGDRRGVLGRGAREACGRGRGGLAGARHVRHVSRALGTSSQVDFSHFLDTCQGSQFGRRFDGLTSFS